MAEESVEVSFWVPREAAEEMVEEILDAEVSEKETWDFKGEFDIEEARKIRENLEEQLSMIQMRERMEDSD